MIYLLLSVSASTLLFVIFKLFNRYKIDTLQAIVINYITACITGLLNYDDHINIPSIISSKWFYGALALGFLFISVFNLMALTSQRNGLSVASVASKMSVIIPVIFSIYAYNEGIGIQKITGIVIALVAVFLTSVKPNQKIEGLKNNLIFPFLLFFGSGVIDTSIKYIETTYVPKNGIPIFSATIFSFAATIGIIILSIQATKNQFKFHFKNVIGGVILGVVNYYSIYYLLKALQFEGFESSTLFTINNVAIVMLSTLLGLVLFKERIIKINWIGISLAIISIIMVTLA